MAPDEKWELVNRSGRFAMTLTEMQGVPVVIEHVAPGMAVQGSSDVYFIVNDRATTIEGVGIEIGQLIKIAESIIAQSRNRGGRP
jgi:hypothetical protein